MIQRRANRANGYLWDYDETERTGICGMIQRDRANGYLWDYDTERDRANGYLWDYDTEERQS